MLIQTRKDLPALRTLHPWLARLPRKATKKAKQKVAIFEQRSWNQEFCLEGGIVGRNRYELWASKTATSKARFPSDISGLNKDWQSDNQNRFNLPRLKSELLFSSHGDNFQDNDSTECETPQWEDAGDDTETLSSNPLAVADAACDDDAEADDPHIEQSFGAELE